MSLHTGKITISASALSANNLGANNLGASQERAKECARENADLNEEQAIARLWIVCCEETAVTQQISAEIDKWELPYVRSLLISPDSSQSPINEYRHNLPSSDAHAVAQSEYAIFITPSEQPCPRLKVSPLDKVCNSRRVSKPSENSPPATLLKAIHNHHGQSPQAWWLQLPTTEVCAQCTHPVAHEKCVAQALKQIGIFVRNYQVSTNPATINSQEKSAASRAMAADKRIAAEQR